MNTTKLILTLSLIAFVFLLASSFTDLIYLIGKNFIQNIFGLTQEKDQLIALILLSIMAIILIFWFKGKKISAKTLLTFVK